MPSSTMSPTKIVVSDEDLEIFKLVTEPLTWDDANLYCQQHFHSNLATINSDYKNIVAQTKIANYHQTQGYIHFVAVGFTDIDHEGIWMWLQDDTECHYAIDDTILDGMCIADPRWREGEPQNIDHGIHGREHCARYSSQGVMVDYNCGEKEPFLCDFNGFTNITTTTTTTIIKQQDNKGLPDTMSILILIIAVIAIALCFIGSILLYCLHKNKKQQNASNPSVVVNIFNDATTNKSQTKNEDLTDEDVEGFTKGVQELVVKYPKAAKYYNSNKEEKQHFKSSECDPFSISTTQTTIQIYDYSHVESCKFCDHSTQK